MSSSISALVSDRPWAFSRSTIGCMKASKGGASESDGVIFKYLAIVDF